MPRNDEVRQFRDLVHGRDALLGIRGVIKVLPVTKKITGRDGITGGNHRESVAIESQTVMGWRVSRRGNNFNPLEKHSGHWFNLACQFSGFVQDLSNTRPRHPAGLGKMRQSGPMVGMVVRDERGGDVLQLEPGAAVQFAGHVHSIGF